jgi:hypothetical protein
MHNIGASLTRIAYLAGCLGMLIKNTTPLLISDEVDSLQDESGETKRRVEKLKRIDKQEFDRVWSILTECGEQERHFNTLQSAYRGLASTWLLAMFGGLGFMVKDMATYPDKWLMIFGLGLAAAIGILLLWMLDVLVYHRLLLAYFENGKEIERACGDWLPPFRNSMKSPSHSNAVRKSIAAFYAGLGTAAVLVAEVGAIKWLGPAGLLLPIFIVIWGAVLYSKTLRMDVKKPAEEEPRPRHRGTRTFGSEQNGTTEKRSQ